MTVAGAPTDIGSRDDISALVVDFYTRAFADDLLGPVFTDIAEMDLQAHLPIMCDFWETVLFQAGRYRGNALRPHVALHAQVRLTAEHFSRWLALWTATVDERHAGVRAERAKDQATGIAHSIQRRLAGGTGSQLLVPPVRSSATEDGHQGQ